MAGRKGGRSKGEILDEKSPPVASQHSKREDCLGEGTGEAMAAFWSSLKGLFTFGEKQEREC